MWETWVGTLCWEDPLEKEMAAHSSILTWRIPWTGEPVGLQSTGVTKSWTQLSNFTSLHFMGVNRDRVRTLLRDLNSYLVYPFNGFLCHG